MSTSQPEVVFISIRVPRNLWLRATMATKAQGTSFQRVALASFEAFADAYEHPAPQPQIEERDETR